MEEKIRNRKIGIISIIATAMLLGTLLTGKYLWPAIQRYDRKQVAEMKRHLEITSELLAVTENHQAALAKISTYWQKYGDEKEKKSLAEFNSTLTDRQKNLSWQKVELEKTINANIARRFAKYLVKGKFPRAEAVFFDYEYQFSYKTILENAQIHQNTLSLLIETAAWDALGRAIEIFSEETVRLIKSMDDKNFSEKAEKEYEKKFLEKLAEIDAFLPGLKKSAEKLAEAKVHLERLKQLLS